ncbi:MAG: alpha/beta hydrolase [Nitrospinae bacterium]|nr:alpha/beta hydrolase [Nitrospinota bacterium]
MESFKQQKTEDIGSFESKFKQVERLERTGGKVEVYDIKPENQKSEIPTVLAPGWAATPEVFKENIRVLTGLERRVISVNAPHGIETASMEEYPDAELRKAAALISVLEEKNIEKIDAIGHSDAGIYLIIAATLYPERFRNIVLIDPSGMIGEDTVPRLLVESSMELIGEVVRGIKDRTIRKPLFRHNIVAGKVIGKNPIRSFREILAITDFQIQDLLRDLKKKGVGISIIHGVDDKFFPIDKVGQIANKDMVDGFYSVKGSHNEIFLNPEKYTKLAENALSSLEAKAAKKKNEQSGTPELQE